MATRLSPTNIAQLQDARRRGAPVPEIAARFNVSEGTVYRHTSGAALRADSVARGTATAVVPGPAGPAPLAPVEQLTPCDLGKGKWDVDNASVERRPSVIHNGVEIERLSFALSGVPRFRARNGAALDAWREQADRSEADEKLAANAGKPVTVLVASSDGSVSAREFSVSAYNGRTFLLQKRSKSYGWYAEDLDILAVEAGYNKQDKLAEKWADHKAATTPAVDKLDARDGYDDLPVHDFDSVNEPPNDISAVYLLQHPGFGDNPVNGAMFLATDVQPGEGPDGTHIVNGYFYAPPGSDAVSEHGSFYTGDLARWGGKVRDYKPGTVTFSECLSGFEDLDRDAAFRRILDRD